MDEPPSYSNIALADVTLTLVLGGAAMLLLLALLAWTGASKNFFFPDDPHPARQQKEDRPEGMLPPADPRRLLVTILLTESFLLVSLASVLITAIGKLSGVISFSASALFFAALLVALAAVVAGNVLPAVLASRFAGLLLRTGGIWRTLVAVLRPLSSFLLKASDWATAKARRKPFEATEREKLEMLETQRATSTGADKEILRGMISFGQLSVKQTMRPRSQIASLDHRLGFADLIRRLQDTRFSRLPVLRDQGQPAGMLYVKDMLPYLNEGAIFAWQTLVRTAFVVPETKKIDALLKDFQKKHIHIAVVVNAFGHTVGLITLEDIIREVIADINSEAADKRALPQPGENTFVFDGQMPLGEICQVLGMPSDHFQKAGGSLEELLTYLRGEMLRTGDVIHYEPFTFTVESVRRKHIKRVRVHVHEQEER